MEQEALLKEIEAAKRRVKAGIEAMSAAGIDTSDIEATLRVLEETQALHFAEMQRMLNGLNSMPMVGMMA
jgi:ribosomal protein L10